MQDPDIKRLLELTEENNRLLHKMRRGIWWGRFFSLAWWILVLAVSGVTYYYYLQPYVARVEQLYMQAEKGNEQAQNYGNQISNFFGGLLPKQ